MGDYRSARVGAAAACFFAALVIVVVDAFSPEYEASPIILAILLGTGAALLGVEILDVLVGLRK